MNNIPNAKIASLQDLLVGIDKQLFITQEPHDEDKIRVLIDKRRHALAQLHTETHASPLIDQHPINNIYNTNPQTQEFIDAWCARVKRDTQDIVSFQSYKFCNLFIDHILPQKWHFDNDVIVVISPPSEHIISALKDRGQNHIVIYCKENAPADITSSIGDLRNTHICMSADELERLFSLIQTPAQQVITLSCETNQLTSHDLKQTIIDAVNAGKKTRFENTRTVSKFGQSWAKNVLHNLPELNNARNLHELQVAGVEDAVVVASGPSLNKNVHKLCEIQNQVFIVTALRSLPVLHAAGVTPDLVIQLDAEDDEVAKNLTPDPNHTIKNFLVEPTVNPGFLKIPANQLIWSLGQHFFDIHNEFDTKPTPFNVPSVSIYGLCLCHHLGFKNICFIGQDLAADGDQQYAKGATELLPAHAKMSTFNIEVPGFFGNTVMTRNSFHYQIKRCTEISREWKNKDPNINLVNATEGGAYIEGFTHISLDNYATTRNLDHNLSKKQICFETKVNITQTTLNAYLLKIGNLLDRMNITVDQIIKLDKKPEKSRGLTKKIQKIIRKFQALNDQTSLVQIAMQDNIAIVIGTSEKAQKIGTHAEFFEKVRHSTISLRAAVNGAKSRLGC